MDPKAPAHETKDYYDGIVKEIDEAFQNLLDA